MVEGSTDGPQGELGSEWIWSRSRQRRLHLVLATTLGVSLYSPLGAVGVVEIAVQVLVFPTLALSGLLLWKGHTVRERFGR